MPLINDIRGNVFTSTTPGIKHILVEWTKKVFYLPADVGVILTDTGSGVSSGQIHPNGKYLM